MDRASYVRFCKGLVYFAPLLVAAAAATVLIYRTQPLYPVSEGSRQSSSCLGDALCQQEPVRVKNLQVQGVNVKKLCKS